MKFENIKVVGTYSIFSKPLRLQATRKGWFRDKEVQIYMDVLEAFYLHNYKELSWPEKQELRKWIKVNVKNS